MSSEESAREWLDTVARETKSSFGPTPSWGLMSALRGGTNDDDDGRAVVDDAVAALTALAPALGLAGAPLHSGGALSKAGRDLWVRIFSRLLGDGASDALRLPDLPRLGDDRARRPGAVGQPPWRATASADVTR